MDMKFIKLYKASFRVVKRRYHLTRDFSSSVCVCVGGGGGRVVQWCWVNFQCK